MSILTHEDVGKVKYFMDEIKATDNDFELKVLKAFQDHFGFFQSIFWICEENFHLLSNPSRLNISQQAMDDYDEHFYEKDPIIPAYNFSTFNERKQRVIDMHDLISPKEFEQSYYYNDFLREQNLYHNLGLYLVYKNSLIGYIDFCWPKNELLIEKKDLMSLELIARALSEKTFEHILQQSVGKEQYQAKEILSPREKEVFRLLIQGYTNKEVAESLFISVNTVKKHVKSIFEKYHVTNRSQLLYKDNVKKERALIMGVSNSQGI